MTKKYLVCEVTVHHEFSTFSGSFINLGLSMDGDVLLSFSSEKEAEDYIIAEKLSRAVILPFYI